MEYEDEDEADGLEGAAVEMERAKLEFPMKCPALVKPNQTKPNKTAPF